MEIIDVPHGELVRLVQQWEPEASQSPPGFRKATCVKCAQPMVECWHLWFDHVDEQRVHWRKEAHLCQTCGADYAVRDPDEV